MTEILYSSDFWKFALPLFGAVVAWFVNEWRKRLWEQYQRKEASYKELLRCLRGFYVGINDAEKLKGEFLDQLNICWLYCSDEVIRKGYAFLDTVHSQQALDSSTREQAMGAFVSSIRNDLLSRKLVRKTKLTSSNFRHFGVN